MLTRMPESIASFPDDPTIEFKVGRMALGYAAQEDRLVLVAHDIEAGEDESIPPTLSCRFTREQARSLSESCAEAVAGGVPFASSVTVRLILKDICVRAPTATKSSHGVRGVRGRPEPVQSLTDRAGPLCSARNMLLSQASLALSGCACNLWSLLPGAHRRAGLSLVAAVWTSS